jgi:hypothetical protein
MLSNKKIILMWLGVALQLLFGFINFIGGKNMVNKKEYKKNFKKYLAKFKKENKPIICPECGFQEPKLPSWNFCVLCGFKFYTDE